VTDPHTEQHTGQHTGQPTEPLAEQPVEQSADAGVQDVPTEAGSGDAPGPGPGGLADESPNDLVADLAAAQTRVSALTDDLQRLQAEYVNYKRRVDRDRDLVKQNATYAALAPITEVMDTIDRAREHGEVEGGFKAVADQLERILAGVGLVKFGAVGDPFDPTIHEALSHIGEDPEVTVTTCKVIAKAGYRIGDRVVRAAQVLVVDPATGPIEDVGGGTLEPPDAREPSEQETQEEQEE
jgi:molecular chaperone GrpE